VFSIPVRLRIGLQVPPDRRVGRVRTHRQRLRRVQPHPGVQPAFPRSRRLGYLSLYRTLTPEQIGEIGYDDMSYIHVDATSAQEALGACAKLRSLSRSWSGATPASVGRVSAGR
jgi:hypothetical protein